MSAKLSLWVAHHHHRHGIDSAIIECAVQPFVDDAIALFEEFEEEREDEWVEVHGPMEVHMMVYDKDRKLLPRGHLFKQLGGVRT